MRGDKRPIIVSFPSTSRVAVPMTNHFQLQYSALRLGSPWQPWGALPPGALQIQWLTAPGTGLPAPAIPGQVPTIPVWSRSPENSEST